jgi:hypothetical protein
MYFSNRWKIHALMKAGVAENSYVQEFFIHKCI